MTFPRVYFLNGEICNSLCAGDCKEVLIARLVHVYFTISIKSTITTCVKSGPADE